MPRQRSKTKAKQPAPGRRPVWSGTLAFGLVTLPVDLYSATRPARAALRMIDADGTPLRRRYVAHDGDELLEDRDIVRGYDVGDDEFVQVEDAELEALDPERSRVIDLESFVPYQDIDPGLIENSYVLVPDPDATTAYSLLVKSMTDADRAGIATFVMRGNAYVVAILAHDGTLRAVTLRYHDELRSPADLGLPELQTADAAAVERYRKAMKGLLEKQFDPDDLVDRASGRLRALAEKKLEKGSDVHAVPKDEVDPEPDDGEVVDIMALLRQSLGQRVEA